MEELIERFETAKTKAVQRRIADIYKLPLDEVEKELVKTATDDFDKATSKEAFADIGIEITTDDELEQLIDFVYGTDCLEYGCSNYDSGWHNW